MCSPFLFISNLEILFFWQLISVPPLKWNYQITPGVHCDPGVWFIR